MASVESAQYVNNGRETGDMPLGRPISLRAALIFGAVISGVLVISTVLAEPFGSNAALAGITAAGFADAHSGRDFGRAPRAQ